MNNQYEHWEIIKDYPNYSVSNHGRIWNTKFKRFLKLSTDTYGYLSVELYAYGASSRILVHRLVAQYFILHRSNADQINHIDGNKQNNWYNNLEWCTPKENLLHAHRTGLKSPVNRVAVRIIELDEIFESQHECAKAIGGSQSAISECLSGKRRKHRGYTFELT